MTRSPEDVRLKRCKGCKKPFQYYKLARTGHCTYCWTKAIRLLYNDFYQKNKCACGNQKQKQAKMCWRCWQKPKAWKIRQLIK